MTKHVRITDDGPRAQRVAGTTYHRGEVHEVDDETAEVLLGQDHFEEGEPDNEEPEEAETGPVTSDQVDMSESDFDEDTWLDQDYEDRVARVRSGEVDDHLDAIASMERSQAVMSAVEERQ